MSILKCTIMEKIFLSSWLTSRKNSFPFPGQTDLAFANIEINGSVFQQCFLSHAVLIVNITLSEVGKDAHTCVLIHDG